MLKSGSARARSITRRCAENCVCFSIASDGGQSGQRPPNTSNMRKAGGYRSDTRIQASEKGGYEIQTWCINQKGSRDAPLLQHCGDSAAPSIQLGKRHRSVFNFTIAQERESGRISLRSGAIPDDPIKRAARFHESDSSRCHST